MKETRIKILEDLLIRMEEAKKVYREASPAWTLIRASQGFIKSVHHLEVDTNFDDETLGAKYEQ